MSRLHLYIYENLNGSREKWFDLHSIIILRQESTHKQHHPQPLRNIINPHPPHCVLTNPLRSPSCEGPSL